MLCYSGKCSCNLTCTPPSEARLEGSLFFFLGIYIYFRSLFDPTLWFALEFIYIFVLFLILLSDSPCASIRVTANADWLRQPGHKPYHEPRNNCHPQTPTLSTVTSDTHMTPTTHQSINQKAAASMINPSPWHEAIEQRLTRLESQHNYCKYHEFLIERELARAEIQNSVWKIWWIVMQSTGT